MTHRSDRDDPLVGPMSLAPPRPCGEAKNTAAPPNGKKQKANDAEDDADADDDDKAVQSPRWGEPSVAVFCGTDDGPFVDVVALRVATQHFGADALPAEKRNALVAKWTRQAARLADVRAAAGSGMMSASPAAARWWAAPRRNPFFGRLSTRALPRALFEGRRRDGLALLWGQKWTAARHRVYGHAETPVYPLDHVDRVALKVYLLFGATAFAVHSQCHTSTASLAAQLSCAVLIVAQTLCLVFARSALDGSVFDDLAALCRFPSSSSSPSGRTPPT